MYVYVHVVALPPGQASIIPLKFFTALQSMSPCGQLQPFSNDGSYPQCDSCKDRPACTFKEVMLCGFTFLWSFSVCIYSALFNSKSRLCTCIAVPDLKLHVSILFARGSAYLLIDSVLILEVNYTANLFITHTRGLSKVFYMKN